MDKLAERIYDPIKDDLAIFRKTNEEWGSYSNMASGFPIVVNGVFIRSSEALYQSLKFPNNPELQMKIISERSPMTAKMVTKPYKNLVRKDFEEKKILIMKWCVRAKLLSNNERFKELLLKSEKKIIVEESRRDSFWGAKRQDDGKLIGVNVLGRILMELREDLIKGNQIDVLGRLDIPDFYFLGEIINPIHLSNLMIKSDQNMSQNDFF